MTNIKRIACSALAALTISAGTATISNLTPGTTFNSITASAERNVDTSVKQGKVRIIYRTTYFDRYYGNTVSIVDALKSLGEKSDYNYRASIAAKNGISNYRGTAAQNTKMLNLLKKGNLIKIEKRAISAYYEG